MTNINSQPPTVPGERDRFHNAHLGTQKDLITTPVAISSRAVSWPSDEVASLNATKIAGKTNEEKIELVMQLEAARNGGVQ